jgi:hypothetical protein
MWPCKPKQDSGEQYQPVVGEAICFLAKKHAQKKALPACGSAQCEKISFIYFLKALAPWFLLN